MTGNYPEPARPQASVSGRKFWTAVYFKTNKTRPDPIGTAVCPPTSTYAVFNVITAPKTLAIQPEQGHNYPQEQWEVINNWVVKQLGLK